MFIKLTTSIIAIILILFSSNVLSYNQKLADSYYQLFQPVAGAKAGKGLHLMKPDVFVANLKKGKKMVTLDVRTPAETGVFTMVLPGSIAVPANKLFSDDILQRLPVDNLLVVICQSGVRATAVGTALRHIGFKNVYILKGGIHALSGYLNPKVANMPLKPKALSMK